MAAKRIDAESAHEHMEANSDTLLVCAYESDEKFKKNQLKGAIPLSSFKTRESTLSKDQEIIFY